ncbi:stress-response A/B barrel domain-containing protein UP3-like [Juglans microcarpa x Juglans regia]|uniref:stress-response A/B barrel domain-containing protein UP3-like n=1 Tax=Juglans microcarpa x Juglans regia TaxID=2249226 RepID=UPI001B7DA40E|nr:stress-response A/B barrel domain-containing protein UP3-like [Juglans microcarpa x Juglans regia]
MLSLKGRTLFSPPFSFALSLPKHIPHLRPSFSLKTYSQSSPSKSPVKMSSSQTVVEHVVLVKVKENTDLSKVNTMVSRLNSLSSLEQVLHLTAGPVLRSGSSSLNFTHALHSRYRTKDDLAAYSAHPSHLSVVKESLLPIIDDIMAVDWVAAGGDVDDFVVPPPGSAIRFTFLKLKENLGDNVKSEILAVIKEIKGNFSQIKQISCGENFSPARAKGFSLASLVIFPEVSEMEAVDSNEEWMNSQKEKVRDYLEGVVCVDYVIPQPQSASL